MEWQKLPIGVLKMLLVFSKTLVNREEKAKKKERHKLRLVQKKIRLESALEERYKRKKGEGQDFWSAWFNRAWGESEEDYRTRMCPPFSIVDWYNRKIWGEGAVNPKKHKNRCNPRRRRWKAYHDKWWLQDPAETKEAFEKRMKNFQDAYTLPNEAFRCEEEKR